MADTQYGLPLIVNNLKESTARGLKRVRLEKSTKEGMYKERWLQELVSRYPNVLPIEQIEPALAERYLSIRVSISRTAGSSDTFRSAGTASPTSLIDPFA